MTKENFLKLVEDKTTEEKKQILENKLSDIIMYGGALEDAEILGELLYNEFHSLDAEIKLPSIYHMLEKFDKEIAFSEKAIGEAGFNPHLWSLYMHKGDAYVALGKKEGSIVPYAQEALTAYASAADGIKQLSQDLDGGKLDEIPLKNFVICLNQMSYIYYEIGMYDFAFKNFNESWNTQNSAFSGYYLAKMYLDGLGVEKNTVSAKFLFEQVIQCKRSSEDIATYTKIISDTKKQLELLQDAVIETVSEQTVTDTAPVKKKSIFGKISDVGRSIAISISHIPDNFN